MSDKGHGQFGQEFKKACEDIWGRTSFRKHFDKSETPCAVDEKTGFVAAIKKAAPYETEDTYKLGRLDGEGKVNWLVTGTSRISKTFNNGEPVVSEIVDYKLVNGHDVSAIRLELNTLKVG